jgi:NAD dependent epimerase/dehydratase family enzyme
MRIAISGSTGLVGSALGPALTGDGHAVVPITRRAGLAGIAWDGREVFDAEPLRACDAIIHLAGAGIADVRWSAARRRELSDSRLVGTAALARLLAADPGRVSTLIVASATGYYGDRGEAELDESSVPGSGFLAGLCRDWEAAADPCRARVRQDAAGGPPRSGRSPGQRPAVVVVDRTPRPGPDRPARPRQPDP